MDFEQLNKDQSLKSTLRLLADKFGENNFKLKDHWEEDSCAIGITDNEEKYLVYLSTNGDKGFYVSLENLKESDDFPYEPAGDFDNLNIDELEAIVAQHLRL